MRFNTISLQNIRSYQDEKIVFPAGSVLLSGNIGSGKSTILLAIDFALFGLRQGELSGASLLRNGKDKGSVELNFTLDNKEITIKRGLKRAKGSVTQDSGYIIIGGERKEGTAVELKQAILELFNYPKELLSKNKALIYRFTVYTPQEEMKQILLGDKEQRLDTLRRVFGIDKYMRIAENCSTFINAIKGRKKELSGRFSDLDEKKEQKILCEESMAKAKARINMNIPDFEKAKKNVLDKKEGIAISEERIKDYNEIKRQFSLKENSLGSKREQLKKAKEKVISFESQIKILEQEKLEVSAENFSLSIESKKKLLKAKEGELEIIKEEIQNCRFVLSESNNLVKEVTELDTCPKCRQKVPDSHKSLILEGENSKIAKVSSSISLFSEKKEKLSKEIAALEDDIELLRKRQHENEMLKLKAEAINYKRSQLNEIKLIQDSLKKEIAEIGSERIALLERVEAGKTLEDNHKILKHELETLQLKLREIELENTSLEAEHRSLMKILDGVSKEIAVKEKSKKDFVCLSELQDWLGNSFTSIVREMEKNVMLKVHYDFNTFFEKWFGMLVDSDSLIVKLDSDFSPLIEQSGYDMEYSFLSGGEKTAAALAYRLALNQVINNMMSTIKTNDTLILDEPTDGFSSEQLDRMKNVLDEINISQVIIVSHETKVESFVDSIIKVSKEENISRIL